jgi:hypothetical protein
MILFRFLFRYYLFCFIFNYLYIFFLKIKKIYKNISTDLITKQNTFEQEKLENQTEDIFPYQFGPTFVSTKDIHIFDSQPGPTFGPTFVSINC